MADGPEIEAFFKPIVQENSKLLANEPEVDLKAAHAALVEKARKEILEMRNEANQI